MLLLLLFIVFDDTKQFDNFPGVLIFLWVCLKAEESPETSLDLSGCGVTEVKI